MGAWYEFAQLGEHRPGVLEHVAVGVAAKVVSAGVGLALPTAVSFPRMSRAVVTVAVELHGEAVLRPAAVDYVASDAAVGLGQGPAYAA